MFEKLFRLVAHRIEPGQTLRYGLCISQKSRDHVPEYIIYVPIIKWHKVGYSIETDEYCNGWSVLVISVRKFKHQPIIRIIWGWVLRMPNRIDIEKEVNRVVNITAPQVQNQPNKEV